MTTSIKTRVWETIPTQHAPHWADSPEGWRRHQLLLVKFARHLEEQGIRVELPKEVPGRNHDGGVDLYVYLGGRRIAFDLKSFWLRKDAKTYTWLSEVHAKSQRKAFYSGRTTDFYIHADFTVPVDQWLVARAKGLEKSKYTGFAPYYYHNDVTTFSKFTG